MTVTWYLNVAQLIIVSSHAWFWFFDLHEMPHQNPILHLRGFASVAKLRICQLHVGDGYLSAYYVGRSSRFVSHSSNLLGAARVCICFNVAVMCREFTKCVSDVQSMLPSCQSLAVLLGHRGTIPPNMYHHLVGIKTLQVRTPCSNWFWLQNLYQNNWWCFFPIAEQYTVQGILLVIVRCIRRGLPAVVDTYNVAHIAKVSQLQ